jgi:hypothetical protein
LTAGPADRHIERVKRARDRDYRASAILVFCVVALAGCKGKRAPKPPDSTTGAAAGARVITSVDAVPKDAAPPHDAAADARRMSHSASTTILAADAGAGACKLLRPALMQTHGGPAAIRFVHAGTAEIAELVFNEAGRPHFSAAPLARAGAIPEIPMPPKTTLPGCAVAAPDIVYCPDSSGAVHRTHGSGEDDTIVARSRPGTGVAASAIGDGHVLLAFIRESATSEGLVREAQISLDDGPSVRLSEEGSGATSVELAARGDEVLALAVDARVAMTPTHVRVLRVRDGQLELGRDAVVFVGGSAELHSAGALAVNKEGVVFALSAVANGADSFGMAAVRLSDPPTEYEPVVWSLYPNGLDPAPIAASLGLSPIRVARVRPSAADPDASRVLEVGELDLSGEFRAKCILAESAYVKDVKLAIDRQGAMWLFWRDTRGSHFERRAMR